MNAIFGILIVLLLGSGLFDLIKWKFNIIAILVLIVVWLVTAYNSFVSLRTRAQDAWAELGVQYKRRTDLITNRGVHVRVYSKPKPQMF